MWERSDEEQSKRVKDAAASPGDEPNAAAAAAAHVSEQQQDLPSLQEFCLIMNLGKLIIIW